MSQEVESSSNSQKFAEEFPKDEWDEEIVTIEIDNVQQMKADDFPRRLAEGQVKLIGIDQPSPILAIGPHVYKGEWRQITGTDMMFAFEPKHEKQATATQSKAKFLGVNLSRLHMRQAFLVEKTQNDENASVENENESVPIPKEKTKYSEAKST